MQELPQQMPSTREFGARMAGWLKDFDPSQIPDALLAHPGMLAAGGLGMAAVVGGALSAPALVSRTSYALRSKPSDLFVGYDMGSAIKRRPLSLGWEDRTMGVQVVGATGSGKTTLLTPWVAQDLAAGRDVVVLETHGDFSLGLIPYAKALGAKVMMADTSDPGSYGFNPLAGVNTPGVARRFAEGMVGMLHDNEYYNPLAETTIMHFAVLARDYAEHTAGDASKANFRLIDQLFNDSHFLYKVLEVRRENPDDKDSPRRVGASWISPRTRKWFDNNYLRWSTRDVRDIQGLLTLIEKIAADEGAMSFLCPSKGRRNLHLFGELDGRPRSRGRLIIVRAPLTHEGAESVARTIAYLAMVTLRQGSMARDLAQRLRPVAFYLDELPALLGQHTRQGMASFRDWVLRIRKTGGAVHTTTQGLGLVPESLQKALRANERNIVVLGGISAEDAKTIIADAGEEETVAESETVHEAGSFLGHNKRSKSTKETRDIRITVDDLRYLGRGEAVMLLLENGRNTHPVKVKIASAREPAAYAPDEGERVGV